ncbi:hypothetical protein SSX86_003339 [Deinandra increscens subsp. villosa]|uniref:Carotenoid oxygenase n=1 Tax=Deinandra increscens subsp. villosa TaxID=3103831 RepID=A0AAP0DKX1_9ASTR
MDTLSRSYLPLSSYSYTYFRSNTKRLKYRPTLLFPTSRINKERTTIRTTPKKIFDILDRAITKFLDAHLHRSANPAYILSRNWFPVDEIIPTECEVIHGSIPPCLNGVYLRIGPNPQFPPKGPYHYFDGDGMVHCIRIFSHDRVTFCSRYVKTNKYIFENQVGSNVVPNVIGGVSGLASVTARVILFFARVIFDGYDIGKGIGVANTSLAFLGGKLCALYESDIPYAIKITKDGDIINLGQHDYFANLSMNMSAHPKIDPETNEVFTFRYRVTPPYLTYSRFDANGNKQLDVPFLSMKYTSLIHDMAISQKYAIICDTQFRFRLMNLIRGERLVGVDSKKAPRIGVFPRYATDESEMKWFEVPGFNAFHQVNAWEEECGQVLVLVASNILLVEHFFDRADRIQGSMEKVRIHLETGLVSRHILSTKNLEFPVINRAYIGKKNRYVYAAIHTERPLQSKMMRASGVLEEDDGYLVSYVHDESKCESRFLVMDARSPTLEVIADVKLPQRVPYGIHGLFIRETDLY